MSLRTFFRNLASPFVGGALNAVGKDPFSKEPLTSEVHSVMASSFADPADVVAFKRCKARGGSDKQCFRVGDNGEGCWGDSTVAPVPMCALPPEDFEHLGKKARGAKVLVRANGLAVICELRDRMPHKEYITNGAGIDLNPAACAALGLRPPILVPATWRFVPANYTL